MIADDAPSPDVTSRAAELLAVVPAVQEKMLAEFDAHLVGLLVAGSAVHGVAAANSDLDVYVLTDLSWRQRRYELIDGVEVELLINPISQVEDELADAAGGAATISMFTHGRVVYDPAGRLRELAFNAQKTYAGGPPAIPDPMLPFRRHIVTDLLRDGEDLLVAGDVLGATYLLRGMLSAIVEARYALQQRWPVKDKHVMDDLRRHDVAFAQQLEQCLRADDNVVAAWRVVRDLAEWVLAPVGGLIIEYETPKEHLGGM